MRLLNTSTRRLEFFVGKAIPKYATLSHTWAEEEVSFGEISSPACQSKKGYRKIAMTCRLASQSGLEYAWVDTCCIDKSSSAELSEAINSMYRWYGRSRVCYVYLEDLAAGADIAVDLPRCRWFTRGWTLQELIPPDHMQFYDQDWNPIGSKNDLMDCLIKITGIEEAVLKHQLPLPLVSVARKFFWAAHRQSTRTEGTYASG